MNTPAFLYLIVIPLLAAPVVYLVGRLARRFRVANVPYGLALVALGATWVPFIWAAQDVADPALSSWSYGQITLTMDGLGLLLAAVALVLGTGVAWFSGPYLAGASGESKYYAMLLVLVAVMIGLGCAGDLFNLWIWFEAMAVSSYLLVAFYHEQSGSLEAGLKYLMQSAAGSVLVLLGISLVLWQTGTLTLSEIRAEAGSGLPLLAAGALFVVGFGVKAALVPLHTWLPDAHSQAPSGISAMLSGVVIEAGLIALLRSVSALAGITPSWGTILMGLGVLNMLVGNLLALRQTQVKRLLAYSSLTHMGYIMLGLGITIYAHEASGAEGGFFHLFNHGLMKGLAFLAAGALLYALHLARDSHEPLTINELSGAARRYPWVALAFSLALLSLAGLPPLAGFMSKWQIFMAGFQTRDTLIIVLVIFAAFNAIFSLAYYAPLVNVIYRREPSETVQMGKAVPAIMNVPLILLALALVIIGLWPASMSWLTEPAGEALLAAFGG